MSVSRSRAYRANVAPAPVEQDEHGRRRPHVLAFGCWCLPLIDPIRRDGRLLGCAVVHRAVPTWGYARA